MSNGTFALVLTAGAAVLALWIDARLPRLAPVTMRRVLVHVVFAFVVMQLIPAASTSSAAMYLALFGVALPALVYCFLSAIWFIKLAQSSLGLGAR